MPEGDTIWRTAARLHELLAGRVVTRFATSAPEVAAAARRHRVVGAAIEAVEARGKHLLLRFATRPPAALHTHMGMTGSWHLYRPGSRWRKGAHLARAVVETADVVAVCFTPRTLRWLGPGLEKELPALAGLGPDVMAPEFDAAAARRRLRDRGAMTIGAALLDQTALAGIGNVYRAETLFLCRLDPFTPVAALDDPTLTRVIDTARRLMRSNLSTASRQTTGSRATPYWVYRRSGRPCRRCATAIQMRRHGDPPRSVYWCPTCQRRSNTI